MDIIYMTREAWVNLLDKIRAKAGITDSLTAETAAEIVEAIETGGGDSNEDWIISRLDAPAEYVNNRVAEIGPYAFSGISTLSKVRFGNVKKINAYAFDAGSSNISDDIGAGSIVSALFPECTEIDIYAFECQKLNGEIDFKKVKTIGAYAFAGTLLHQIEMPLVTTIPANCFYQCKELEIFDFSKIESVRSSSFYGCMKMAMQVELPLATSIESAGFQASGITGISAPLVQTLGSSVIRQCTALESVYFPKLTSIGNYCFQDCSILKQADFPSLTKINTYAFAYCSALTALILRGESCCTLLYTTAFNSTPIADGTGYIYVPKALIDTYKSATNWTTYADQFRALEDYTVDGTTTGALDESKI